MVCWNRRYEPDLTSADRELKNLLQSIGMEVQTRNTGLLFEPWEIQRAAAKDSPAPYKVFTAYWRACLKLGLPGMARTRPTRLPALPGGLTSLRPEDLGLLPRVRWDAGLQEQWQPGEQGALRSGLPSFYEQ